MTSRRAILIAMLLSGLSSPAMAQGSEPINADRPGLADSSAVVGKGLMQIETGLQWEKRAGEHLVFAPSLFRVGVADRLELRIEGNTLSSVSSDGQRQTGLAPTSVGVAAVLHDGLGMIGRVFPSWGTGIFAASQTTGDLRVVADWDLSEHFSLNPNAGVGWYEGDPGRHSTAGLFALTLSYAPRPGVSWFIDTGGQVPEVEGGETALTIDGGVAYIPRQNWQFDLSAGTRAHGDTPPRPFVSIGFAYRHK